MGSVVSLVISVLSPGISTDFSMSAAEEVSLKKFLDTAGVSPGLSISAAEYVSRAVLALFFKYLGRLFPGDLRNRGKANLSHRLACGWFKFHTLAPTLLNRKLPIILRLKLFDSVVSPTVTYSLSTTPLTGVQLSMLDATQRKMIRRMVGWVRFDDESWEVTGQRMKARLESALHRFPVRPWSVARAAQRDQIVHKLQSGLAPRVAQMAYQWSPADAALQRGPGRPRQRWYE